MDKIKKMITSVGEDVEKLRVFLYLLVGMWNGATTLKNITAVLQNVKPELPYDPIMYQKMWKHISIQKSTAVLYTSNEQSKIEIMKTVTFATAWKTIILL